MNGEFCYQFLSNLQRKKWQEAADYCLNIGGQLAEPSDAETNQLIADLADLENLSQIHLGIQLQENEFVYASNGQLVTFEAWASGEPRNNRDFASLISNTKTWKSVTASELEHVFCVQKR